MRRRYFSPQLRQTLQVYKSKQPSKLRWVGSQVKLPGTFCLQQQYQQKIGNYTYNSNKEIGSGYSSKVYKAYRANDNTQYAIKVINLKKYSATNMQMLTNQIQILKSLNHPNVLKCYDVYKTASQCFIITEYCNSGDLLNHLTKKGRFNQKQAIEIISDIVAGYRYLSERLIIHRDLKPANILKSGSKWKIADFGFAIRSQSEVRTKYNVGTPLYMPPEALIQNLYSVKSDIFSIGVIFYQLLVGCTPWQSRTEKDLIKKMGSIPFKIPEKYQISQSIKQILQKMCDVKMKKRMQYHQFITLNIKKLSQINQNPQQPITLRKQKSQDYLRDTINNRLNHKSIQANPKMLRLISSKSIQDTQEDVELRKKQSYNNQLLISQLHYCRFLYYLVRNIGCVLVQKKLSQKLGVIIFTHLLKLVQLIADNNINYLNLLDWDNFKKSKKYFNTSITIKQYCTRYQKQYLTYLTSIDLNVLEQVNQQFPQMSKQNIFTIQYYTKITRFLLLLIKSFNQNLGTKLLKLQGEVGKDQSGQIQALKNILKYYRLLEMSITHFQNYQYFQTHCNIKVNIDFKKSGATLQNFNQLRKQLKNI